MLIANAEDRVLIAIVTVTDHPQDGSTWELRPWTQCITPPVTPKIHIPAAVTLYYRQLLTVT